MINLAFTPNHLSVKIRRKTVRCLNCGHTLSEVYNFCPHCGQENNDNNVSFGTFIGDFFSNYFSFDTRIGRSIQPFFLRPGYLTNQFNEGKRTRYVHPLRLYLIVSLIFFFLISLSVDSSIQEDTREIGQGMVDGFLGMDSIDNDSLELIMDVILNPTLSDEQMLDSLKQMGQEEVVVKANQLRDNWVEKRVFSQGRRLARFGPAYFVAAFVKNLPFVLLVAMPIFALLLKGLYIRRKFLYVQHLVHTLHLHSFSLVLFSTLTALYLTGVASEAEDYVEGIVLLLLLGYTLLSFRRVYQQKWLKTIIKAGVLSLFYIMVIAIITLSEVLISFMIF